MEQRLALVIKMQYFRLSNMRGVYMRKNNVGNNNVDGVYLWELGVIINLL